MGGTPRPATTVLQPRAVSLQATRTQWPGQKDLKKSLPCPWGRSRRDPELTSQSMPACPFSHLVPHLEPATCSFQSADEACPDRPGRRPMGDAVSLPGPVIFSRWQPGAEELWFSGHTHCAMMLGAGCRQLPGPRPYSEPSAAHWAAVGLLKLLVLPGGLQPLLPHRLLAIWPLFLADGLGLVQPRWELSLEATPAPALSW